MIRKQKLCLKHEQSDVVFEGGIRSSSDSEKFARLIWDQDDMEILERVYAVFLNAKNEPVSWAEISAGGQRGTVVDMKLLMGHAVLAVASGLVIFHNHPSGSVQPSSADVDMTNKLKECCRIHDIVLLDHLIISQNGGYYSFADECQL